MFAFLITTISWLASIDIEIEPQAHASATVCWLCGSRRWTVALERDAFALWRCVACGLVRTEGPGAGAVYDASYYSAHSLADTLQALQTGRSVRDRVMDAAYAAYLDPNASARARLLLLAVRTRLGGLPPRTRPGLDLLDVGSGDGDFLRRAQRAGYHAVGQEINPAAAESARAAGMTVHLGDLAEQDLPEASFDVVRMWHVLEHVPDPLRLLRAGRRLLRPDGSLVVGVPNFDSPLRRVFGASWSGLQLPFHLHHFTAATLRRTLEKAGFSLRSLRYRSVGTLFSSLNGDRRNRILSSQPAWSIGLLIDNGLDLAARGDTLDAIAIPR